MFGWKKAEMNKTRMKTAALAGIVIRSHRGFWD
jgi:hypothetical protein